MKKKLMSLLLVIAIMVSSVSMGLSAFAAPAGAGIEKINAFGLTANTVTGASGTASVKIKSNNSSYKIKVNSITGYYKYMKEGEDTSKTVSFSIGSNNVCGTSDVEFTASVSIDENLSALIRYECNYDLLNADGTAVVDKNGITLYKGMTGIGYGYISADGDEAGKTLGKQFEEPKQWDSYGFAGFESANTLYVQVPTAKLYAKCETSGNKHSASKSNSVTGNKPSTLTIHNFEWDNHCGSGSTVKNVLWFELAEPPSGYYDFNITFYDGASYDVEMYYRETTHKNSANTEYTKYLGYGLEKSYYEEASWNDYIAALDKVALVAIATHNDNYSFKTACQTAADLSNATKTLKDKYNALTLAKADWKQTSDIYDKYFVLKENNKSEFIRKDDYMVTVKTYEAGPDQTTFGEDVNVLCYDESAVAAFEAWAAEPVAHFLADDIYKYDQAVVDNYGKEMDNRYNSLPASGAVYTYLDVAINEYSDAESEFYTTITWNNYKNVVDNAKALSRSYTTASQYIINDNLEAIILAKNARVKLPAEFGELSKQVTLAGEIMTALGEDMLLTEADGFSRVWDGFVNVEGEKVLGFEDLLELAQSDEIINAKKDEQAKVDDVAYRLGEAIKALARYRLLDVTDLYNAYLLKPEENRDKYEPDSYGTWEDLRAEALVFYQKAQATYTASDRKTYEDYEEMVRLTEVLINAFESIEKVKADFTKLNAAIEKIPKEDVLALYQDEYVDDIMDIVLNKVNYGATFDMQTEVDNVASELEAAIAQLTYEHYKPADYSDVYKAIEEAEAIDRNIVTNYEIVQDAISAVDESKKIVEQKDVDAMAAEIRKAIKNLKYIPAVYDDLEAAIEEAEAVENKDWYANYYKVEEKVKDAEALIEEGRTIREQAEVDAMAAAIREAIGNLELGNADYSGIRDAIALYNSMAPFTDFESKTVDAVDQAIAKVEYGYTADRQEEIDVWETEILDKIDKMKLLPADYSRLKAVIKTAESYDENKYTNYIIVKDAIKAVNWDLTCRDYSEMQEQIDAINSAVDNLQLKRADYSKLDEAIDNARAAYNNGAFPYTQESKDAVEAVIESINWNYDIEHQAEVNAYITKIQIAVTGLTYVRADYTELDELKKEYDNLDRGLYANLSAIDTFVNKTIDWNKTIDKQQDVAKYVETFAKLLENLEYADADYSAVDNEILQYNEMEKGLLYDAADIAAVDEIIASVQRGLKKNEQAKVDKMAEDIRNAVADLKTKMKKANLDKLTDAVAKANTKINEMLLQTDYKIDIDTYLPLDSLLIRAEEYNEDTTIDNQKKVDDLAEQIIEATANLEFVFQVVLDGSGLVIKDGYIYGFEEGTTSEDAKRLIKFVGAAEIKIIETKNGFGTGTMIQFISTKDGSVIQTYKVLVFGDANGDAVIDMFDVAYIVELVNNGDRPDDMLHRVLDLNADSTVDLLDVTHMIAFANMDETLKQDGSMETY